MAETKRIGWIDQLRSLAFYTVIIGHLSIGKKLKYWIYSFHMPFFFMITGMTYNIEKVYKTSFFDYAGRQVRRILVPYVWLQMLSFLLRYAVNILGRHKEVPVKTFLVGIIYGNSKTISSPSNPTYYVLLLFLALICLWFIVRITKGNKTAMFVILSACLLISICTQNVPLPWHINVVPTGMFFIFLGRILMDTYLMYKEKIEKLNKGVYLAACAVMFAIGYVLNLYNGRISIHDNKYGKDYMVFIVCSVITSVAFTLVVMLLPNFRILSFLGKNTFFLLCIHKPLIQVLEVLVTKEQKSHWLFILFASFICFFGLAPVVWIANKYFPYICGNPIKEETTLIKVGKFLVIAAAGAVPYLYFNNHFMGGILRESVPMMLLSAAFYLIMVVICERIGSKWLTFMFIQEKKASNRLRKTE